MIKVAVVLSGCGYLDGSEIREAVITLLELDKAGAEVKIFAPNTEQHDVINHLTGKVMNEKRNTLVESARIARGKILDLVALKADDFDALVLPGGFGVAKNLSDFAIKGTALTVLPEFDRVVEEFFVQKKPIGAICISPAVLVAAVKDKAKVKVTIGTDNDHLITTLGGEHQNCAAREIATDEKNNIISCPAYMLKESLAEIAAGIENLVKEVVSKAKKSKAH